ncbi:MAG: tetraacyldisaccharide 4'-kinase, partial [Kiloniellaceae bacterium]
KTPLAIAMAAAWRARGRRPHCLARGYGGHERGPLRVDPARHDARAVGDEALLLARAAPTWIARDRVAGARAAAGAGADVVVLDDGFQNPCLRKDLSLVAVDGAYGFGNGRVMPARPLRESMERGLARADAVVVIGPDAGGIGRALRGGPPVLSARLEPNPEAAALRGRRVLAFAGIGRPEKFFATLVALGARVAEKCPFPDHHPYRQGEVDHLLARAAELDATPITTEKDAARLPADTRQRIAVLGVALVWDDPAALDLLLDRLHNRPVP